MNFSLERVPKKISPCSIAEAVVELRFDSDLPADAILGVLFNKFKEKYPQFSKLPVLELPSFFRDNDENFKFSPYYRMTNNDFIFQIGPRCFSLACPKEYKGWKVYSREIEWVFNEITALNFVKNPLRLGVRYINFFEDTNIFEKTQAELSLAKNSLLNNANILRSEFTFQGFQCVIQMTNTALLDGNVKGSSLDIDVIYENKSDMLKNHGQIISSAHDVEKTLFFGILKNNFLETLSPEY